MLHSVWSAPKEDRNSRRPILEATSAAFQTKSCFLGVLGSRERPIMDLSLSPHVDFSSDSKCSSHSF